MSEIRVNKVTPATGSQVELEATTVLVDGTLNVTPGDVNGTTAVKLKHNGTTKLETTTTGVTVTGTVTATNFTGNGSGLTNVTATGVGGSSSAGSLSLVSDNANSGTAGNDIVMLTGTVERGRIYRSSGDVRFNTDTLCVDAANSRVGIEKTNPAYALDVNGTVGATALTVSGAASVAGATTLSGNLTVDTDTFFVDATGNRVGIGTASPSRPLSVYHATLPVIQLANSSSGTTATDGLLMFLNGASAAYLSCYEAVPLIFATTAAQGTSTERIRITTAGNVGIGTSNPATLLDVNGTVTANAITVGNQSVTAGQVVFPSTANLSTNANTLDAYAEGSAVIVNSNTGDPWFRFSGNPGTFTLTSTAADKTFSYTRIGNMVMFTCVLNITNTSGMGATGRMQIANLPISVTLGHAPVIWETANSSTVKCSVIAEWTQTTINFYKTIATTTTAMSDFSPNDLRDDALNVSGNYKFRFSGVARI